MTNPMMQVNIDQILAEAPANPTPEQLRTLLETAYTAGALEQAVAPPLPGDPETAEREAEAFAVAARLAITTGALTPLQAILDAHIARKSS